MFGISVASSIEIRALRVATAFALSFIGSAAFAAEAVDITIDFAKIMPLEGEVATIIVGNPGIADVSLQDGNTLVLTGRAAGTTNLIVVDREDKEIVNTNLRVSTSYADITTVFYGSERQSFSCSPTCEQVVSIGDNDEAFSRAIGQIDGRNAFSRGVR